jgi:hypothetical protein
MVETKGNVMVALLDDLSVVGLVVVKVVEMVVE